MKLILSITAVFSLFLFGIEKKEKPSNEVIEISKNGYPINFKKEFDGSVFIEVQTNQHEVVFSKGEPSHTLSASFKTKHKLAIEVASGGFTKRLDLCNLGASAPNYVVGRISDNDALDLKNVFSKNITVKIFDITKGLSFEETIYSPSPIILSAPLVRFDRAIDSSAISKNDFIRWNADALNKHNLIVRIEEQYISKGDVWPKGNTYHFMTPDDGRLAVKDIEKYIKNGDYFSIQLMRYNEHIVSKNGKKYQLLAMTTSTCYYKYKPL